MSASPTRFRGGAEGVPPGVSSGRSTPGSGPTILSDQAGGVLRETRLPSGIQVLTESIPSVRSAATGVWIRHGAAHESPALEGGCHLLEHMVFKGTRTRTARQIALELEALGGTLDAYTSREHTSFQARVLDRHLPQALEVLADLVLHPLLRPSDLELERQVVLEEISMVEDTPDDLVFELHGTGMWGGHPYGRSILGSRDAVQGFQASQLQALRESAYRGPNLVVAAAGNVDHDEVVARVESLFGEVPADGDPGTVHPLPDFRPGRRGVARDLAQTHIVIGCPAPAHSDPRRHAIAVLTTAFGGGMSSILFQRIREELGLAYTVFSYQSFLQEGGTAGVYVGTRPEWAERAEGAVLEEMARVSREGLTDEVLEQTRNQLKGQVMLSLESTGSRLYRLAHFALFQEEFRTLDQVLALIDGVTAEDVREVAAEFWNPDRQYTLLLGPQ